MYGAPIPVRDLVSAEEVIAAAREARRNIVKRERQHIIDAEIAKAQRIMALREKARLAEIAENVREARAREKNEAKIAALKAYYDKDQPHIDDLPRRVGCQRYPAPIGPLLVLSTDFILDFISEIFGVSRHDIMGPWRDIRIVRARQCVMWMMRHYRMTSYPEIGLRIGGKDHTTVIHAVRVVDFLIAKHGLAILPRIAAIRILATMNNAGLKTDGYRP